MTAPPEAGLGRRRGWGLPHFGTKAEERQSPALLVTPPKAQRCDCRDQSEHARARLGMSVRRHLRTFPGAMA
jgi:hypothetical protein